MVKPSRDKVSNWRRNNPDKHKAQLQRNNLRMHGTNQEWFESKFKEQDGKCGICHKPFGDITPHIDHNHSFGCGCKDEKSCAFCNRGLLCIGCNHALGRFQDNVDYLTNAILYLNRYSVSNTHR